MVYYRRNLVKGGTYFFTVNLRQRNLNWLTEHANLLRTCMRKVKNENLYLIKAIVILPDHLHTIWSLPEGDDDFPLRWRKIKTYFTQGLVKCGVKLSKNKHGEYGVWQRRFWEHTIRDEKDMENHVNYIHYNPVKHGYVEKVGDWSYSSFHLYVKKGFLPKDWAGKVECLGGIDMGERKKP